MMTDKLDDDFAAVMQAIEDSERDLPQLLAAIEASEAEVLAALASLDDDAELSRMLDAMRGE